MPSKETKEAAVSAAKAAVEAYGPPTRVILRVIFILLVVVGLLWVISKITGIILLLVLSIFFAYLVSPLVEFLRQRSEEHTSELQSQSNLVCRLLLEKKKKKNKKK